MLKQKWGRKWHAALNKKAMKLRYSTDGDKEVGGPQQNSENNGGRKETGVEDKEKNESLKSDGSNSNDNEGTEAEGTEQ